MASQVSATDRNGVILLATRNANIFVVGLIAAAIPAALVLLLLLVGYADADSMPGIILSVVVFYVVGSLSGLILKAEFAAARRSGFTLRFPILYSVVFLAVLLVAFLLTPTTADFLGLRTMLSASLIVPVLFLFVVALLYTFVLRTLFFTFLGGRSSVDLSALINGPEFAEKLDYAWDGAVRYSDPLTTAMFAVTGVSDRTRLQAAMEELVQVAARNVRRSDTVMQIASDTVAVIISRAPRTKIHIPLERIMSQAKEQGELASIPGAGIQAGVASYDQEPRPESAAQLLQWAREALGGTDAAPIRYSGSAERH